MGLNTDEIEEVKSLHSTDTNDERLKTIKDEDKIIAGNDHDKTGDVIIEENENCLSLNDTENYQNISENERKRKTGRKYVKEETLIEIERKQL